MRDFVNKNIKFIIAGCMSVITIAILFQVGMSMAISNETNSIYTRDELSEKVSAANEFLSSHPVGSEYSSFDSQSPEQLYGGTWVNTWSDYERIQSGSQQIYDSIEGTGIVSKTPILCQRDYYLIYSILENTAVPTGYHVEYKLTAQVYTEGDNIIRLYLNNISTSHGITWSEIDYRRIISTAYFKDSDITIEPTYLYPTDHNGINLYYEVTSVANKAWKIWAPTISAFITSDNIIYKWKRTA